MRDLLAPLQAIQDAMRLLLTAQRVTVQNANPLTVQLQDGSVIAAVRVAGLTYTAGGSGIALIADRGQPIVLPTS